eukprot:6314552-Amphidinium_carterae.2
MSYYSGLCYYASAIRCPAPCSHRHAENVVCRQIDRATSIGSHHVGIPSSHVEGGHSHSVRQAEIHLVFFWGGREHELDSSKNLKRRSAVQMELSRMLETHQTPPKHCASHGTLQRQTAT